jgi:hypothetical protein
MYFDLIYRQIFCQCHNVPLPGASIKNKVIDYSKKKKIYFEYMRVIDDEYSRY